ncbi:MAG: hypothetical protein II951_04110 [Bacteroidales bacterium]|nr:hypothetical protein [Bacteroidales bacterium]
MAGCTGTGFKHPDIAGCRQELKVRPFYKDFMESGEGDMTKLSAQLTEKYGEYFRDYCRYEIKVGEPGTPEFVANAQRFLSYDENGEVLAACDSVWGKLDIDDELSDAFSCFASLFPSQPVPKEVNCHFSGFNSKMFVDSAYISFSIEHFLGQDCRFYDWLELPRYARVTRTPEFIVPNLVEAWVVSTMPQVSEKDDVFSALMYRGKVLYATHACLPDIELTRLFGYSEAQVEWCERNEGRMWAYMAEHKLLFSTNQMDKSKLVNETPFTVFFGNESPGRAATYVAYRIVCSYMQNAEGVSVEELMKERDDQKILRLAKYNP